MTAMDKTPSHTPMPAPAALSPALSERLLAAMLEAAADPDSDDALEQRLRRLRPAPLGARYEQRLLLAIGRASGGKRRSGSYVRRWAAAAALFVACASGATLFFSGSAEAASAGIASRSVVESKAGGAVQWQEGHTAVRHYEVLYEDSFVLDDGEESTITVRVPNRTQVLVEDEVI